jgi:hypothetical protein
MPHVIWHFQTLTKHSVPKAEDGSVVFVDAVSVAAVMDPMKAGSIEYVFKCVDTGKHLSIKMEIC